MLLSLLQVARELMNGNSDEAREHPEEELFLRDLTLFPRLDARQEHPGALGDSCNGCPLPDV